MWGSPLRISVFIFIYFFVYYIYNNGSGPAPSEVSGPAVPVTATFHAAKRTFFVTKRTPATYPAPVTSNATLLYLLQDP